MVYEVLLVEDDPMVATVNRGYIQEIGGFQVTGWARTGAEAVRMAPELRPHLVLLDVYLPGGDGLHVLRQLRQLDVPADVIAVSAAQDAATIQNLLRLGAVDYIIKPFRFERLREALAGYRHRHGHMHAQADMSQSDLDRVLHAITPGSEGEDFAKGLNQATLDMVRQMLDEAGDPVTAALAAARMGVSRVTARRYLDHLVKIGEARVQAQYGVVGRPVNLYHTR